MSDFLDIASDLLRSNSVNDKRRQFERVFSALGGLQVVHSKAQLDLTNIESIFTALELGKIIKRVPGIPEEEIPATISALKELIVKTLEETILFPCLIMNRTELLYAPHPYSEFSDLLISLREKVSPSRSVSVITFNYDLAVDMALFRAGLGPDYIISKPPFGDDLVPLMKLHGSINWAIKKRTKRITPLHLATYFQNEPESPCFAGQAYGVLPIGSTLVETFKALTQLEVNAEPVIVPPSWNKADYHQALSDVWAEAARHLSEAEYIFIIGYSLPETDSFFRHLYALGSVGKSALRKLVVFNPDTAVNKRFEELLGSGAKTRYEFSNRDFERAIEEIKPYFGIERKQ